MEAIANQYRPQLATTHPSEAAALHTATVIAGGMEWGSAGEDRVLPFEASAWAAMGLHESALPALLDDAGRQYDAATQAVAGAMN